MNRRKIIKIMLAVVCVVCIAILGVRAYHMHTGRVHNEQAQELVKLPKQMPAPPAAAEPEAEETDPLAEALADIDLSALKAINPDVIGWIYIPDTVVSYPLLIGENNNQYLRHTWLKEYSTMGSIFMETESQTDLSDFNTIIYGHRMRDMSMFAILQYYDQKDYWEQHPSVYLVNDSGVYRYDIYAAYESSVRSPAYYLQVNEPERKAEVIQDGLKKSAVDTGIVPTEDDKILTLSTCPSRGTATRWIVQAVLAETYSTETAASE